MEARLKLVYCDRSGDENCRSRSQDQSVGGREAEPDEDGIVSISYGEVFERAVAKMLAAAEASTPF